MDERSNQEQAIELLQQLGLKEYEARCFVALSRLGGGTAKDISEVSDVPRTRVYDAVRVLESRGLVEIQHSSPQRYRAVSVEEATEILLAEYESRTDELRSTLSAVSSARSMADEETHEVWSLSGTAALATRTGELIGDATDEVVLVIGDGAIFTEELVADLEAARDRGVTVVVGTVSEELAGVVTDSLSDVEVFESGLEWLAATDDGDGTRIGRLLLVDRSILLVSTVTSGNGQLERGVFGRGLNNGFVAIVRRMLSTGLLSGDDPGRDGGQTT